MKGINAKELRTIMSDLEDVKGRLEAVRDDGQSYFDERSEKWQEGEAGQEFEECLGRIEENIDTLDTLINEIAEIE